MVAAAAWACAEDAGDRCVRDADCPAPQVCVAAQSGAVCRPPSARDAAVLPDAANVSDAGAGLLDAAWPEAGVSDPGLVIEGTALAGAAVTVMVGNAKFTGNADEQGVYRIDVRPGHGDELVSVLAVSRRQPAWTAASVLGSSRAVVQSAGADRVLDAQELPATRLSGFTTLRYAAAVIFNDGVLPAWADDVDELDLARLAFFLRRPVVSNQAPLSVAGAVLEQLSTAVGLPPPSSPDLLVLATDWLQFRQYLLTVDQTAVLRAALADARLFQPFDAREVVDVYSDYWPDADGLVGRAGSQYSFQADGTGFFQTPQVSSTSGFTTQNFDWSVLPSGELELDFDPFAGFDALVDIEDVADLYRDPNEGTDVRRAFADCNLVGPISVRQEWISSRVHQAVGGDKVHVVIVLNAYRYRFDTVLREQCGVSGPPAIAEDIVSQTWVDQSAVDSLPWSADELLGTWSMPVANVPEQSSTFTDTYAAGVLGLSDHRVTFRADGTAEAVSSLVAPRLEVAWQINEAGQVVITSELGTQTITRLAQTAEATQMRVDFAPTAGTPVFRIWRGRRFDPEAEITASAMQVELPGYWQSTLTVNSARALGGTPLPEDIFGFRFLTSDAVESWLAVYEDDPNNSDIQRSYERRFTVSEGILRFETWRDELNLPCEPGSHPGCYRFRSREWIPIQVAPNTVYVYETLFITAHLLDVFWDSQRQIYVGVDDRPVDRSEQELFVVPRFNAYYWVPAPPLQ